MLITRYCQNLVRTTDGVVEGRKKGMPGNIISKKKVFLEPM